MARVHDLIAAIRTAHPTDPFFHNFEASLRTDPLKRSYYAAYERAFSCLDDTSWTNLRSKAVAHSHEQRPKRVKAPLFDQLNDAFAYRWLVNRGFSQVTILPEDHRATQKSPDISFCGCGRELACDVKTLNVSNNELDRRCAPDYNIPDGTPANPKYYDWSTTFQKLHPTFFKKIDEAVAKGTEQIRTRCKNGLVFILVHSDDYASTFYPEHRVCIASHLRRFQDIAVVVKFGVVGQRRIEHIDSLLVAHAA